MKLQQLVSTLKKCTVVGDDQVQIGQLHLDSRQIKPGDMFIAVSGQSRDGHDYIPQAIERGAVAVLVKRRDPRARAVTQVIVRDTRKAMAKLASQRWGHPSTKLKLVGITGTNGKSTTSWLIDSIFRAAGKTTGIVGTIGHVIAGEMRSAELTTPEVTDLQSLFNEMVLAGSSHAVMEVSSHAIDMHRVNAVLFACGVFTNLSQDHLDYHGSLEAYGEVKQRFFTKLLAAQEPQPPIVVNIGDPLGREIAAGYDGPCTTYSIDPEYGPDIFPLEINLGTQGISLRLETPKGQLSLTSALVGEFNALNIMAAVGAAQALSISKKAILAGVAALEQVRGRVETVPNQLGLSVIVDYAHTPDALQRVLRSMRALTQGRLICVFGCGGDRDRRKRPLMGRVAMTEADLAIVTSDNPRTERPMAIIDDILVGVESVGMPRRSIEGAREENGYVIEADRRNAIWMAIGLAHPGDLVVIAGKGHEDYQILGKELFHFDDREEAQQAMHEKQRFLLRQVEQARSAATESNGVAEE